MIIFCQIEPAVPHVLLTIPPTAVRVLLRIYERSAVCRISSRSFNNRTRQHFHSTDNAALAPQQYHYVHTHMVRHLSRSALQTYYCCSSRIVRPIRAQHTSSITWTDPSDEFFSFRDKTEPRQRNNTQERHTRFYSVTRCSEPVTGLLVFVEKKYLSSNK